MTRGYGRPPRGRGFSKGYGRDNDQRGRGRGRSRSYREDDGRHGQNTSRGPVPDSSGGMRDSPEYRRGSGARPTDPRDRARIMGMGEREPPRDSRYEERQMMPAPVGGGLRLEEQERMMMEIERMRMQSQGQGQGAPVLDVDRGKFADPQHGPGPGPGRMTSAGSSATASFSSHEEEIRLRDPQMHMQMGREMPVAMTRNRFDTLPDGSTPSGVDLDDGRVRGGGGNFDDMHHQRQGSAYDLPRDRPSSSRYRDDVYSRGAGSSTTSTSGSRGSGRDRYDYGAEYDDRRKDHYRGDAHKDRRMGEKSPDHDSSSPEYFSTNYPTTELDVETGSDQVYSSRHGERGQGPDDYQEEEFEFECDDNPESKIGRDGNSDVDLDSPSTSRKRSPNSGPRHEQHSPSRKSQESNYDREQNAPGYHGRDKSPPRMARDSPGGSLEGSNRGREGARDLEGDHRSNRGDGSREGEQPRERGSRSRSSSLQKDLPDPQRREPVDQDLSDQRSSSTQRHNPANMVIREVYSLLHGTLQIIVLK